MLKFNSQIRYGLRAMIFLANQNKQVNIREISRVENIPHDFLEKIMLKLKNAGIVESIRGQAGGFVLSIKPEKLNLEQIFQALDEKLIVRPCQGVCLNKKNCQAKNVWQTIDQTFKTSLKQIKLSQIIK
jgi:Rrf2 family protein